MLQKKDIKITKYEQISEACGIKFQPFIFETTGKIHPSSLNWFKEVMRTNVHDYMGGNQLEEYWIKRINCAYLHQISKNIIETFNYQKGSKLANINFENRVDFILESTQELNIQFK